MAMFAGLAALPAGAAAGPLEDAARQAAPAPGGAAVERVAPAVREMTARVEPAVRAATNVEPVRSTVDAMAGSEPVRSATQAIVQPTQRVAPGTAAAVAAVVGRPESAGPTASPRRQAIGQPRAGGIDRGASRRSGDDLGTAAGLRGTAVLSTAVDDALNAIATAEQARAASSSTAASGDDGFDFGHPFGHGGGADIGGPLGVALVALLGLLAGTLLLAPRFFSRLLPMSPARWGPVAFLSPIERPG